MHSCTVYVAHSGSPQLYKLWSCHVLYSEVYQYGTYTHVRGRDQILRMILLNVTSSDLSSGEEKTKELSHKGIGKSCQIAYFYQVGCRERMSGVCS